MAETHEYVNVTTATWQYFLRRLWNFVKNTQSGIVKFATDGIYYGIKSGGVIQTTDAGLQAGFGTANDYIVIEPVNAYPGGGKWQIMFKQGTFNSAAATQGYVNVSWLGGWTQAADGFGTVNMNTGDINNWIHSGINMTTSDAWYLSCANSDSYMNSSGSQSYTYMRALFYKNSNADGQKFAGAYAGGYIPVEANNDTKPCVLLYGRNSGTNAGWSLTAGGGGKISATYAHLSGSTTGNACINNVSDVYTGYGMTRSGNWAHTPTIILDLAATRVMGSFGNYTQMVGQDNRQDSTCDTNKEYLVSSDQVFRWKTTS